MAKAVPVSFRSGKIARAVVEGRGKMAKADLVNRWQGNQGNGGRRGRRPKQA